MQRTRRDDRRQRSVGTLEMFRRQAPSTDDLHGISRETELRWVGTARLRRSRGCSQQQRYLQQDADSRRSAETSASPHWGFRLGRALYGDCAKPSHTSGHDTLMHVDYLQMIIVNFSEPCSTLQSAQRICAPFG